MVFGSRCIFDPWTPHPHITPKHILYIFCRNFSCPCDHILKFLLYYIYIYIYTHTHCLSNTCNLVHFHLSNVHKFVFSQKSFCLEAFWSFYFSVVLVKIKALDSPLTFVWHISLCSAASLAPGYPDHMVFSEFRRRFDVLTPHLTKKHGRHYIVTDEKRVSVRQGQPDTHDCWNDSYYFFPTSIVFCIIIMVFKNSLLTGMIVVLSSHQAMGKLHSPHLNSSIHHQHSLK